MLGTATASSHLSTALVTGKLLQLLYASAIHFTDIINRVGYGQHGDYLFGWKDDSLQKAMDALPTGRCANANCNVLKIQSAKDAMACKKPQMVRENVGQNGEWLKELPGGVQVTYN